MLARLRRGLPSWSSRFSKFPGDWKLEADLLPGDTDRGIGSETLDQEKAGMSSTGLVASLSLRQPRPGVEQRQDDWYDSNPELEKAV